LDPIGGELVEEFEEREKVVGCGELKERGGIRPTSREERGRESGEFEGVGSGEVQWSSEVTKVG
jgi:hypothetical protein